MPAAARALLFALFSLAAPAYLQAVDQCSTSSTGTATKYTLTVEPADYKENTNYTVTVKGVAKADNFNTVQLQALDTSKSTPVALGIWTKASETSTCDGHNLLYNTPSNSFTAHWTSPSKTAGSVEIRAYITEAGETKLATKKLPQASSSAKEPTKETGATKKPDSDATHTTHSTAKPPSKSEATTHKTKGGSDSGAYSSCILIAILQSVYLLFITGK